MQENILKEVRDCLDANKNMEQETILFYAMVLTEKKNNAIGHTFIQMESDGLKERVKGIDSSIGIPEELYSNIRRAQQQYYDSIAAILKDRGYNV